MSILARLGLGVVWLVSGALKAVDPAQTWVAVQAYQVLPLGLVGPVARALPVAELMLGTLLLVGVVTRWAALASVALLVVFTLGVVHAWVRGLSIDCGCFGGGGVVPEGTAEYLPELARTAGLLILAGWLLVRSRTVLSVDGWRARGGRPTEQGT